MAQRVRVAVLLATLILAGACGADGPEEELTLSKVCASSMYPEAPSGGPVVFVNPLCTSSAPDGTLGSPFTGIFQAVAAAQAGSVILLAEGSYVGGVDVGKAVHIVGAGDGTTVVEGGQYGLAVSGDGATVEGIDIRDVTDAGVACFKGTCTLRGVRIESVKAGAEGAAYGVYAAPGTTLALEDVAISQVGLVGIYLDAASGSIYGTVVESSGYEGVRAKDTPAGQTVTLTGTTLKDNHVRGLAAFGADVVLGEGTTVAGTRRGESDGDAGGDGVVATCLSGEGSRASTLKMKGSAVDGSARVGVLLACGSSGTLDGATVRDSGKDYGGSKVPVTAGVWAQGAGVSVDLVDADLLDNRMSGLGTIGGAEARIDGSRISGTKLHAYITLSAGAVEIGDGVSVLDGGRVELRGSTLAGNERVGVILDAAAKGSIIADNQLQGGDYGIVTQNLAADAVPALTGNAVTDVVKEAVASDVGLPVNDAPFPAPKLDTVAGPEPFPL